MDLALFSFSVLPSLYSYLKRKLLEDKGHLTGRVMEGGPWKEL